MGVTIGYETRISPVVGVPPEVTDLDLTMEPIGVPTSVERLENNTAGSSTTAIIASLFALLTVTLAMRGIIAKP